jgi:ribosomal-protein-alanine N-acetyltransferase
VQLSHFVFRAEIGFVVSDDKNWGKGFMGEALKPIIEHGFEQINLHRIEVFIGLNKPATYKILAKNDFVKEGHLRENYFRKCVYEDSLLYALLKKDYEN